MPLSSSRRRLRTLFSRSEGTGEQKGRRGESRERERSRRERRQDASFLFAAIDLNLLPASTPCSSTPAKARHRHRRPLHAADPPRPRRRGRRPAPPPPDGSLPPGRRRQQHHLGQRPDRRRQELLGVLLRLHRLGRVDLRVVRALARAVLGRAGRALARGVRVGGAGWVVGRRGRRVLARRVSGVADRVRSRSCRFCSLCFPFCSRTRATKGPLSKKRNVLLSKHSYTHNSLPEAGSRAAVVFLSWLEACVFSALAVLYHRLNRWIIAATASAASASASPANGGSVVEMNAAQPSPYSYQFSPHAPNPAAAQFQQQPPPVGYSFGSGGVAGVGGFSAAPAGFPQRQQQQQQQQQQPPPPPPPPPVQPPLPPPPQPPAGGNPFAPK